jgi:cation diffusion facilitator family transporter
MVSLTRFAWLSIAAAVLTIGIKAGAWLLTGSVGLLSDAIESVVNLAAAILALIALTVAEQPPDQGHEFGHNKAEYFSSGIEGTLIVIAALVIAWTAIPRLFNPEPITQVYLGVAVMGVASLINLGVAIVLHRAGKRYRSITLEADAQHLFTDVWTSLGVVVAIVLVAITGWYLFDPIIALVVAANIVWTGVKLMRRSASGLMDASMDTRDLERIEDVLEGYRKQGIGFHALRTRKAGTRSFVTVHVLAPGGWSIKKGHDMVEEIEAKLRHAVPGVNVLTHLEPLDDDAAMADVYLDRK